MVKGLILVTQCLNWRGLGGLNPPAIFLTHPPQCQILYWGTRVYSTRMIYIAIWEDSDSQKNANPRYFSTIQTFRVSWTEYEIHRPLANVLGRNQNTSHTRHSWNSRKVGKCDVLWRNDMVFWAYTGWCQKRYPNFIFWRWMCTDFNQLFTVRTRDL